MRFSILNITYLFNIYAGRRPAFETNSLVC